MQIVPIRNRGFVEGIGVAVTSIRTPGFEQINPGSRFRVYRLGFVTSFLLLSSSFVENEIGRR